MRVCLVAASGVRMLSKLDSEREQVRVIPKIDSPDIEPSAKASMSLSFSKSLKTISFLDQK